MEKFYPYLDMIFLALIVVFLLVILFRVIGRRIGFQREDTVEIANTVSNTKNTKTIKAIRKPPTATGENSLPENAEIFAEGSLNAKLAKVKKYDEGFDFREFITTCKTNFVNIVTNFNNASLEKVKNLLTPKMYEGFNKYITEHNLNQNIEVERFLIADIVEVDFKDKVVNIKVKFVTKQKINDISSEFREIWNFTKNTKAETKNWQLSQVLNG